MSKTGEQTPIKIRFHILTAGSKYLSVATIFRGKQIWFPDYQFEFTLFASSEKKSTKKRRN